MPLTLAKHRYSFLDDYSEGCHPRILKALSVTNLTQQTAYGDDEYSVEAKSLILDQLGVPNTSIFFVAGGTSANIITIAALLRPHEAIIAPETGHIVSREAGAIAATGHKIITVKSPDGKLTPALIKTALEANAIAPHMAKPRLVYISNAAETGRIYTRADLTTLSEFCKTHDLYLFLDGARLGAALTSSANDLTLADITKLTDAYWLGGTKAGALLGEAIITNNSSLASDLPYHIKQRGALLAKGRILGLQFRELFQDGLYFEAAAYANDMARKLAAAFLTKGYTLASPVETNQLFPIVPDSLIETMEQDFRFYVWEKLSGGQSILRLVTSWATDPKQIDALIAKI